MFAFFLFFSPVIENFRWKWKLYRGVPDQGYIMWSPKSSEGANLPTKEDWLEKQLPFNSTNIFICIENPWSWRQFNPQAVNAMLCYQKKMMLPPSCNDGSFNTHLPDLKHLDYTFINSPWLYEVNVQFTYLFTILPNQMSKLVVSNSYTVICVMLQWFPRQK